MPLEFVRAGTLHCGSRRLLTTAGHVTDPAPQEGVPGAVQGVDTAQT